MTEELDRLHGYPSIYAYGHAAAAALLDGPVVVEEKVDGSQISFGVFEGELVIRSKRAPIRPELPGMFAAGVAAIQERQHLLRPGWQYRGEYLAKPHHNVLTYSRVPTDHIIIFDIQPGLELYLDPAAKRAEAQRLGCECVPLLYAGDLPAPARDTLQGYLEQDSILGGQKVEGVVVKNYAQFGRDKKVLMGKLVSPQFQEIHAGEWKKAHPGRADVLTELVERYRTPARWHKAVQHLREAGELRGAPQDIGPLLREVQGDIAAECGDEIRAALYAWAWKEISRRVIHGLPEWYKNLLAEAQFGAGSEAGDAAGP